MPETYPGKILITRPMNHDKKIIQVEVERATGHYVIQVEVSEAEVARMLLGSFQVPCTVTDYTTDVATHLERRRWLAGVGERLVRAQGSAQIHAAHELTGLLEYMTQTEPK